MELPVNPIDDAITTIISVMGDVVDLVQNNALFMIFASVGVLAIGISVVKKLIGRY